MGVLQGIWFDAEELMERADIELYVRPVWQYVIYYTTLVILSIIEFFVIRMYRHNSKFCYLYITALSYFIWGVISLFFIFSIQ
jgi:hypothetical protein